MPLNVRVLVYLQVRTRYSWSVSPSLWASIMTELMTSPSATDAATASVGFVAATTTAASGAVVVGGGDVSLSFSTAVDDAAAVTACGAGKGAVSFCVSTLLPPCECRTISGGRSSSGSPKCGTLDRGCFPSFLIALSTSRARALLD